MTADQDDLLPSGWERPTGRTPLKRYFWRMRLAAEADYRSQVVSLLDPQPEAALLDCGCNDGAATAALARRLGTTRASGVEIVDAAAAAASARGIEVRKADLAGPIPWPDGSFDVVTALESAPIPDVHPVHPTLTLAEMHRDGRLYRWRPVSAFPL